MGSVILKIARITLTMTIGLLFAAVNAVSCFSSLPPTATHTTSAWTSTTHSASRRLSTSTSSSTRSSQSVTIHAVSSPSSSATPKDQTSTRSIRSTSNKSYLRWKKDDNDKEWKMQTAVQTFVRGDNDNQQRVELHAQLHYGDEEYFKYWNSNRGSNNTGGSEIHAFNDRVDHVLFELLVDDDLLLPLDTNDNNQGQQQQQQRQLRVVKAPITASPNDRSFAQQYGWSAQASVVDYTQPKWIHADLSRQEFVSLVEQGHQQRGIATAPRITTDQQQPLWQLVSSAGPQSSSAAAEAVSALLVGPPSLLFSTNTNDPSQVRNRRRLFTNLFLPGSTFAFVLRSGLWLTVPSPELSIILLDWSSLLEPGTGTNPNALSKVALPILSSLVRFDFTQMRRFVFGQVLMSSNSAAPTTSSVNTRNIEESDAWSLLVTKRNDHALDVLQHVLGSDDGPRHNRRKSVALLYGSSHCPDLHQKLVMMGFQPKDTSWRTVWSVDESDNDRQTLLPSLAAVLLFYLGIGALDWVGFLGDVSESFVESNYLQGFVDAGLYLARHVLFYLGMSKFLIEWTNNDDT